MTDPAYILTPAEAKNYIRGSEPWPLRNIIAQLVGNALVLEVGCANGIQAARMGSGRYVGVDWSQSLLIEARGRLPLHRFVGANVLSLPFGNDMFDTAYAISLLEHLPGASAARQCIAEMLRVARRALIGWHTPPRDEPTACRRVIGHFGRECWSNRYNAAEIIEPNRVTIYSVPATDGSLVWEIV